MIALPAAIASRVTIPMGSWRGGSTKNSHPLNSAADVRQRVSRASGDTIRSGQHIAERLVHERGTFVELPGVHRSFTLRGDHERETQGAAGPEGVVSVGRHALNVQQIDRVTTKHLSHLAVDQAVRQRM